MGVSIIIGKRAIEENGDYVGYYVEKETLSEAPQEDTDGENVRHASYGGWHDFTESTGLDNLFYDKEVGLFRDHPGCKIITKEHLEQVETAFKKYKPTGGDDYNLKRFEWLLFWMRHALKKYDIPAIFNC